jgi:hypothetical protein
MLQTYYYWPSDPRLLINMISDIYVDIGRLQLGSLHFTRPGGSPRHSW